MTAPTADRPYVPRLIDIEMGELLAGIGAVLLQGAKAVGKTRSAQRHAVRTVRLDRAAVADVVRADPAAAIRAPFPVFFDEWHRVPEILDEVRLRVDDDPTPGLAILAGSAEPPKNARPTHTGAGRVVTRRMRPMTISERLEAAGMPAADRDTVSVAALLSGTRPAVRGASPWELADYAHEIVASGFPAIRTLAPRLRAAQLEGYVEHLVTRDIEEANGAAADPAAVRRWLTAYAAATATTTSLDKLRDVATAGDGTPPAKTTVLRYRNALERLFIYDPVPAWKPGGTALSRLGEAPKIHLVDPGLAAHLLGIDEGALLDGTSTPVVDAVPAVRDGGLFGALFESLVAQAMRTYAQALDAAHHYIRTYGGDHEIDGVLVRRDHRCLAYEVRLAGSVNDDDGKHLRWLREHLGDQLLDAVLIHTGPEAYRRKDGIAVVPAALLVP